MSQFVVRWMITLSILIAPMMMVASSSSSAPQLKTRAGVVEGKAEGSVHAFLGIPYAAPPVGDLRWKAPVPAARWTGVRKATEFGPHCMQGNVFGDMTFRDAGASEDCLSLNVWVPSKVSTA